MNRLLTITAAAALLPFAAFAEGDIEKGAKAFSKCVSCHVVVNDAGETLAGKSAKTGPNLYKVLGHAAGSVEGFNYGTGLVKAKEMALEWTEENFVAYLADPTKFLRSFTGDKGVRGNMSFQIKKEDEAKDIYAYLISLNPAEEAAEEAEAPAKTN